MKSLPASLLTSIAFCARTAYPHECCGVLLGRRGADCLEIEAAVELPNVAPAKEHRFLCDPRAYAALEGRVSAAGEGELAVLGYFHSHPDAPAVPSAVDLEDALGLYEFARTEYVYAIQRCDKDAVGELRLWKLDAAQRRFVEVSSSP